MAEIDNFDFLVTGCHRSGTTLFSALVSSHSRIVVLNEHLECNAKVLGGKLVGLKAPIPRMDINRTASSSIMPLLRKIAFRKFSKKPFAHVKRGRGIYRLCIQDFIDAQKPIFFMTRRRDENIESIMRHTWQTKRMAMDDVEYAGMIQSHLAVYAHFVSLEKLTTEPEQELSWALGYLGLSFEEKMLEGYKYSNYEHNGIVPRK